MHKKMVCHQPRILVIEDERGRKSSYFPALTWNALGYSLPLEHKRIPVQERSRELLSRPSFAAQGKADPIRPFDGFDTTQKIFSVKNILRDISRRYESVNNDYSYAPEKFFLEKRAYLHSDLLYLIAATEGNKDTVGHSLLVARYTLLLTEALGIDDRAFSVDIERGALLHDIGKIGIPHSILRKPGSLTAKEREIIKEHPFLGFEMVEGFPFLQKASQVVLFHHESFNGLGYPYGLKGEEIPLVARIFAIADTLDAITSDRPYRKGKSFRTACDEIEQVRGSQFDPAVVDAFFSVPEEKWLQVKRETEGSLAHETIH